MRVVVFGGSGFLGSHLIRTLATSDHQVVLVSRRPHAAAERIKFPVSVKSWFPVDHLPSILNGADVVVNLSGESIGAKRWTSKRKQEILTSRTETTKAIVDALSKTAKKPAALLNASAVGYYGNVPEGDVTESHPQGHDFLANVCAQWEAEAMKAEQLGIRVVMPRSGIVLARNGGALERMLLPFNLFVGGPLGSGKQWFPWIHIEDEINAMVFGLENSAISGPLNFAAPDPVTMKQFCEALGRAMHRPSWAPVPSFVLRTILGEMAEALVLGGQKAVPSKLAMSGFQFKYNAMEDALRSVLQT